MSLRIATLRAALGAAFLFSAIGTLGAEPSASIAGNYRVGSVGVIVAIADCEGGLCGRIVGLGNLPTQVSRCPLCQAAALPVPREQLCGAVVVRDLSPTANGWSGELDDPQSGEHYTLNLAWSKDRTQLLTQRRNAPPFLTRSMPRVEAWTPVPPPEAPCGTTTPTS